MASIIGLSLRALEFVFTVILLGLVGALEAQSSSNPESVHFSMFTAAFSMFFLFYLIPATWKESIAGHPLLPVVIDTLNAIFFFCAAVTLAARTHGDNCGRASFIDYNEITQGSKSRCHEAQAACAFFWFGWACYMGSIVFDVVGGRSTANLRPRSSVRRPGMSQV